MPSPTTEGASSLLLRGQGLESLADASLTERCEELDARDNAISDASEASRATGLRTLLLGRNSLCRAPVLRQLTLLRDLDLSDNKLETISLEGLSRLRALNLAGNCLRSAGSLTELEGCQSLEALDLSRNLVADFDNLIERLRILPLKLLSLLGNPVGRRCSMPGGLSLAVWNAKVLEGKEAEAAALRRSLPDAAGIFWSPDSARATQTSPTEAASEEYGRSIASSRVRPADSVSSIPVHAARNDAGSSQQALHPGATETEAGNTSPRDSAADRDTNGATQRTFEEGPSHGILDSADDMTSGGRTPFSSASESGPGGPTPGRTHSQALPGLADRQDSANYQPRPPALAERQDSAQNLQAMAEAEAELTRTGSSGEATAPARQDSAHELDESARSPTSPEPSQSYASGRLSDQAQVLREANAPAVSPRQSSASDMEALRHPHGTLSARASAGLQTPSGPEPSSAALLDSPPTASLEAARLIYQSGPPERGEEWVGPNPFRGDEAQPLTPTPRQVQSRFLDHSGVLGRAVTFRTADRSLRWSAEGTAYASLQDSALDSLAEARRAVLADMPRSGSVPTSDPLQQARQLLQATLRTPGSLPLLPDHGSPARMGSPQPSILQSRPMALPESPFQVTPLSPQWTVSQLQPSYSQQLPRITSGVPFTTGGSNVDSTSGPTAALMAVKDVPESSLASQARGGLLEEARRVVLGDRETTHGPDIGRTAAKPPLPSISDGDVGPSAADSMADSPRQGRRGEGMRETPYPDSPLAAGAAGSRSDSAFFERQASQEAAGGPSNMAESSQAASAMA